MSKRENILSSFTWKFGERISAQLVSTIVSIILARLLMPDDYGIVSIVTIVITLCNSFVVGGFGNALIQKKDANNVDFSSIFYVSIFLSLILYMGLFFLAKPIALFYGKDILCPIIRVMGIRIPIAAVNSIQHAYFSRQMQFKKFFLATLIGTMFSAVVGISMALKGFGPWALVGQYLTNVIINTIVLFIVGKWRPMLVFSVSSVKNMLPFSLKLMSATLLDSFFNEIRSIIIFTKYSSVDLSMYENGKKYPNLIVTNINTSISSVLFPAMSNVQTNIEQIRSIMKKSIKLSTFALAPLLCGFFAVASRFVGTVLTDKWMGCVPFIQITCCMCIFYPIHTVNVQALNAIGESGKTLKLEIVKKVLNVVVLVVSLWFGVIGIALGGLLISLLSTWINAVYGKRYFAYSFLAQLRDILPVFLISVAMAIFVAACDHFLALNGWIALILDVLIGGGIYLILCKIFRVKELQYLIDLIKKVFKK